MGPKPRHFSYLKDFLTQGSINILKEYAWIINGLTILELMYHLPIQVLSRYIDTNDGGIVK